MGEHIYNSENKSIMFSEDNEDIGCLCTFPHNDFNEKGDLIIDEYRLFNLALLGCAVCLIHNTEEFAKDDYIFLPRSIEKYYKEIKKCIEKIKNKTIAGELAERK